MREGSTRTGGFPAEKYLSEHQHSPSPCTLPSLLTRTHPTFLKPGLQLWSWWSWMVGPSQKDCPHVRAGQGFGSALLPAWWLGLSGESEFIPQDTTSCLGSGVFHGFSILHSNMEGLVLPSLLRAALYRLSSVKSIRGEQGWMRGINSGPKRIILLGIAKTKISPEEGTYY